MKISPTLVGLKNVHCKIKRSEFLEADLTKAAQLVLTMGGIVNPLVLRKTGMESYTVIDGIFEYWVAIRAKEIDPFGGETINAYIVQSDEEEKIVREQVELFRKPWQNPDSIKGQNRQLAELNQPQSPQPSDETAVKPSGERKTEEVKKPVSTSKEETKEIRAINQKLDELVTLIKGLSVPTPQPPKKPRIRNHVRRKSQEEIKQELKTLPNQAAFVEAVKRLSDDELVSKLEKALAHSKGNKKFISQLLTKRKGEPFNTILDMMNSIQGLGPGVVRDILTNWS